jgi:hypothetical protein
MGVQGGDRWGMWMLGPHMTFPIMLQCKRNGAVRTLKIRLLRVAGLHMLLERLFRGKVWYALTRIHDTKKASFLTRHDLTGRKGWNAGRSKCSLVYRTSGGRNSYVYTWLPYVETFHQSIVYRPI